MEGISDSERVTVRGVRGGTTLATRARALEALDQRLGFDDADRSASHRVAAEFSSAGHLRALFAQTPDGLATLARGEDKDATVRRFVAENAALWDLQVLDGDPRDLVDLLPAPKVTEEPRPHGHTEQLLSYNQTWRGLPLADEPLVAHFVDGERFLILSGHLINQADVYFDPVPTLTENEAAGFAVAAASAQMPADGFGDANALRAEYEDLIGHAGERRLIYKFRIKNDEDVLRFTTWVDAHTGEIFRNTPQWGEYQPTPTQYKTFYPLTTDDDQFKATKANWLLKSGTYSAFESSGSGTYFAFDNGAALRSAVKVYAIEYGLHGGKYSWYPDSDNVFSEWPGNAVSWSPSILPSWVNRKFNTDHIAYWGQIHRNYVDQAMAMFAPPGGYGPGLTQVVIAGCDRGPSSQAITIWGCNFAPNAPNYTGLLEVSADEAGRPCVCMPKAGQTLGESAQDAHDGTVEVGWLWHELSHGTDFRYGKGTMRPDAEPSIVNGGAGTFHEPIANVIREVIVADLFPTSYNFNDYFTDSAHGSPLKFQVGSAGTVVDQDVATRKCYPISAPTNPYKYGHPLYQAVWESARGMHCHGAACVALNDGATSADAVYAAFEGLKYALPDDGSGTFTTYSNYFLAYYLGYTPYNAFVNRRDIFDWHDLTDNVPAISCNGNHNE